MNDDQHATGEQPTAPIPRTGRTDDPTQIFETFGTPPDRSTPRTQALPTGEPATRALPTEPPPVAEPDGRAGAEEHSVPRVSAFGADAAAGRPTGPAPAEVPVGAGATSVTTAPQISRTLRVGTVVWGLIIAIIGAGLIAVAAGARFDMQLVLIGLLALAGVALVAGSIATSMRHRH